MLITGNSTTSASRLRRWTALVSTLATATVASVTLTAPASASVSAPGHVPAATCSTASDFQIYLTSATTYGPYDSSPYIEVKAPNPGLWYLVDQGQWSADGITGESWEFEVATDAGCNTGVCMGDTVNTGWVVPMECGANGTSWVEVRNGGGYYLYNRYFLDKNSQQVLVAWPNSGDPAAIEPPGTVGGGEFGRWAWRACIQQCP
jgi:hypothetical protein